MEMIHFAHAIERMLSRKISTSDVENVMKNYDGRIKQSMDKWIYFKKVKDRKDKLIAVVALLTQHGIAEILTVMNFFEVKK